MHSGKNFVTTMLMSEQHPDASEIIASLVKAWKMIPDEIFDAIFFDLSNHARLDSTSCSVLATQDINKDMMILIEGRRQLVTHIKALRNFDDEALDAWEKRKEGDKK